MIFNRPSFRSHHQVRLVKSAYRPAESGPVHPRLVSWNCTALEAESARHFSHQTGQEMDVFIQKHWENMGRLRINGSFDDKTSFDYQRVPHHYLGHMMKRLTTQGSFDFNLSQSLKVK